MSKQLHNGKQKTPCDEYEFNCIIGAITKRAVSDRQLAAYFQETYSVQDVGKLHDSIGRTALHMAASCGRSELCEWLIFVAGADINCRDWESGYTPLQRAVFYGQIKTAVKLLQMGADLTSLDKEGLNAVNMLTKENPLELDYLRYESSQVYIWGSNDNYTLGIGTNNSRKIPELLDNFKARKVNIKQVCMDEFHSVFVSRCNKIWVCGNGQGGRLGISSKNHCLTPTLLLNKESKTVSIALNHTLIFLGYITVLACGQNDYYQLGLSPYVKETTTLKEISIIRQWREELKGVCAAKYHSVFYSKTSVFVCGLNGGQFGLTSEPEYVPFVKVPTKIPINLTPNSTITSLASSNTCIVFSVTSGSVYILYRFMFKKIASKQKDINQISTIGGSLKSSLVTENCGPLKVVILTERGSILIWQESVPQMTRCMFGLSRQITISYIFLNEKQILFTTKDGEAFSGTIGQIEKQTVDSSTEMKSGFHKFLAKSECYHIETKRIPNVHLAVAITSDPKGKNFAVTQVNPRILDRTQIVSFIHNKKDDDVVSQFLHLLDEASEEDNLHDITFKVQNTLFPAHKYIVACANSTLLNFPIVKGFIIIDDVLPVIFKEILTYIYTGHSDLLKIGPLSLKFSNCSDDPVKLLLDACSKFKFYTLSKKAIRFKYENGCVSLKKTSEMPEFSPPKFSWEEHPQLYDVILNSDDGKSMKAHGCVLVARLEYFRRMLLGGWSESFNTPELHFDCPLRCLELLMDFIYTNEISSTIATESYENIGKLLIVADQLLSTRLKEHCEEGLFNSLNLKNVAAMLQISSLYNACILKKYAIEFINKNLNIIIENRVLDVLSNDVLSELENYYIKRLHPHRYRKRIMTPYSEYTFSDETILSSPEITWPAERTENKYNTLETKSKEPKERQQKSSVVTPKKKATPPKKTLVPEMIPEHKHIDAPSGAVKKISTEVASSPPDYETVLNASDFPQLDYQHSYSVSSHKARSTNSPEIRKVFPPRMSQKERKRRSLELEEKAIAQENEKSSKPQFKGWTTIPPLEDSKKKDEEINLGTSPPMVSSFVEIIASEKKEKDNFFKMKFKPFALTQLEDKAIEELNEFYNASNVFDERITVQRVLPINIAKPIWIKSHKRISH